MNQPHLPPRNRRSRCLALVAGPAGGRDRAAAALLEKWGAEAVLADGGDPALPRIARAFDLVVLGQPALVPGAGYASSFRDFEEEIAAGTRAARAALGGMLERDRGRIVVLAPPGLSMAARLLASLASGSGVTVSGLVVGRPWGKDLAAWAERAARTGTAPETGRVSADEKASALAFLHQFRALLGPVPERCAQA